MPRACPSTGTMRPHDGRWRAGGGGAVAQGAWSPQRRGRTMVMKIVNLTPHQIVLVGANGGEEVVPASGQIARVATSETLLADVHLDSGVIVPTVQTIYGQVEGLPEPALDTIYIVSGLVISALGGVRSDVFSPGRLRRGADGQPNGCLALIGVPTRL